MGKTDDVTAIAEESARICDKIALDARNESKSELLTLSGRSAYISFATGAETCAMAIRSRLIGKSDVVHERLYKL